MYADELTEEEADDMVRAPLIEQIRRAAPLLSLDVNFDRWSTEKITALANSFAANRAKWSTGAVKSQLEEGANVEKPPESKKAEGPVPA